MRYVALLRGINVGGHRKVPMADLRGLLSSLGYTDVVTYLQSGNALFTSSGEDPVELAGEIENTITGTLGLDVNVLIRTGEELARVVEANPFLHAAATPTQLHVSFLSAQPSDEAVARIDPRPFEPDQFHLGDRAMYLWYPNGAGWSKLTNEVWERRLGLIATARNWNTVTKLLSLATA